MDFIASHCNLGIAVKQALDEIIFDEDGKKSAYNLYKEIFTDQYRKIKDQLPDGQLSGKVFTWNEYPDQQSRQYFQALIYQPQLSSAKEKLQIQKLSKLKFAKIEAMEPEGQNQKKEPKNKKLSRANKSLKRKNIVPGPQNITNKRRKL